MFLLTQDHIRNIDTVNFYFSYTSSNIVLLRSNRYIKTSGDTISLENFKILTK